MRMAPALWLTVCAGLAAVIAYQLSGGFQLAPTVTAAPPGASALGLAGRPALPRPPDEQTLEVIAARPLFSEDRRPYVAPEGPDEAPAPHTPESVLQVELAGTYLAGPDQAALLAVAGGAPAWLRKGDQVEGWQIGTIAQDSVELSKDGRHQVVRLREDIAAPATARPARDDPDAEPDADEPTYDDEEPPE